MMKKMKKELVLFLLGLGFWIGVGVYAVYSVSAAANNPEPAPSTKTVVSEHTCVYRSWVHEGPIDRAACCVCGKTAPLIREHVHDWTTLEVVEPSCNKDGYTRAQCSACGKIDTFTAHALEHDWVDGPVLLQPTNNHPGTKEYRCAHCGEYKIFSYEHPLAVG